MSDEIAHTKDLMPMELVAHYMKQGFSRVKCDGIHPLPCNQFCFNYIGSVWSNTYKTYGAVYIISLLFRYKKIAKNPTWQIPKFLTEYVRSTSLTAVQMMLMRRILCFLCKYVGNKQNNLIWANFLSAFYIFVETTGRQPEIALYQFTNTSRVIYLMAKRRGILKPIPGGECLLMAMALAIISYFYFDCKQAFRRSYIQTIFKYLLEE